MLENDQTGTESTDATNTAAAGVEGVPATKPRRRRTASRPAGPPEAASPGAASAAPRGSDQNEPGGPAAEQAADELSAAQLAADELATVELAAAQLAAAGDSDGDPAADRDLTTPLFARGVAPATATRPRRRATSAAGPPAADILTAATTPATTPAVPDLGGLLPPRVEADPAATAAGSSLDRQAPAARAPRARRGRRQPAGAEAAPGELAPDEPVAPVHPVVDLSSGTASDGTPSGDTAAEEAPARPRRTRRRATAPDPNSPTSDAGPDAGAAPDGEDRAGADTAVADTAVADTAVASTAVADLAALADLVAGQDGSGSDVDEDDEQDSGRARRGGRSRRRRGGRGRGSASAAADGDQTDEDDTDEATGATAAGPDGTDEGPVEDADPDVVDQGDDQGDDEDDDEDGTNDDTAGSRSSRRRRRRRRRSGGGEADLAADPDDPPGTVVRIRESRVDEVTKVKGSTRLEAKRQRRRDGRSTSRKRTVITEAEFLTRRESVDRTLLVRESEDRTEIAVLEDGVLVEHHVTRASQQSMIGNVYLGKVQNVLPSMEAAFVDIGRGRNAVLYAGEVNWDAVGLTNGAQRKIEDALKPGDPVLAQVSKDPVGHKGARLTAQVSLPGRYLVYVPGSTMTGISRKLPETERTRLKKVLRRVVPEDAGVIVRTAAEGASEAELERDVARLQAQWEDIEAKSQAIQAPARLYSEPDLAIKVVRDVFNEDFTRLIVSGDDTWDTLDGYVRHVAPDLAGRMTRWAPDDGGEQDLFVHHRIDEQIAKALDRKVWLPSGGSLVIDRTEAMTVVDVNTGKYTGNGGNLEETVTRNNLEAAEEVVRQLRLRDIGGIIVVDFIDMVLENNRNLVLRRLVECLGRDRTKHQVAEVTSLGLVQLTRKRVGSGLLESFSTVCEHCQGRGLLTHSEPIGAGQELPAGPGDTGSRPPAGGGVGGGARRRGGRPGG